MKVLQVNGGILQQLVFGQLVTRGLCFPSSTGGGIRGSNNMIHGLELPAGHLMGWVGDRGCS
jgi:hypothetical protein